VSELAKAVVAVMGEVHAVPETGQNKFQNYKYASDTDLLKALQPAMARAGLCLLPMVVASTVSKHSATAKEGEQWRTDMTTTYRLLHVSGEYIDIQTVGCGVDGADKGAYKAATGCLKYALRQLFLVPTGDDAEQAPPQRKERRPDPPPADHDAEFAADSKWFHASRNDLPGRPTKEEVDTLCGRFRNYRGKRASQIGHGGRDWLLQWLALPEGQAALSGLRDAPPRDREPGEEG
jgi:hypothetical protein